MRAYLVARNGLGLAGPTTEGLRALGFSVVQAIPLPFDVSNCMDTDLLVLTGMRKHQRRMRDHYEGIGVPWVAFDLPHIRGVDRETQDTRLYTESHSWLPDVEGLPSRRDRLGVEVVGAVEHEAVVVPKPKGRKPTTAKGKAAAKAKAKAAKAEAQTEADAEAGYALVIGQVPHDSSHGLDVARLTEWAESAIADVREALPKVEIVWRPHPYLVGGGSYSHDPGGYDRASSPVDELIADALAGARLVCCYSSTAGLEALIAGKPVVAWGESCYRELCAKPGEIATATHPGVEAVEGLLERVAYTQWSLDELATGEPFRFLLGQMGIECPVAS